MAYEANGSEAVSFEGVLEIPEDGFDEGALDQESQKTKSCLSDSALVFCISTMAGLRLSERESDASTCGSTNSTRESSVEDARANKKRLVSLGDAEEIKDTKSDWKVVDISRLQTDSISMRRGRTNICANSPRFPCDERPEADSSAVLRFRTCTDSSLPRMVNMSSLMTDFSATYQCQSRKYSHCEDLFHMSSVRADRSALGTGQPQMVVSTLGSTLSASADCGHRRLMQTEDERVEAMMSSRNHKPPHATSLYRPQSEEGIQRTLTVSAPTQPSTPAPSMVSDVAVARMSSSPCISTLPHAQASQTGNVSSGLAHLQIEFQQLQEKQRMLLEERRLLLAVQSACSGMPGWTMPATPPGCWSRSTEPMRTHVHTDEGCQATGKSHEKTTIVIQSLPKGFARDNIVGLLNSQGFAKKFDFIYVPVRFSTMAPWGYAFVNLVSPEAAEECRSKLDGFSDWDTACEEILSIVWSENDQGLNAVIDRHRNSPVMHDSIEEHFKPAIYKDGVKIRFPVPTKIIKQPKDMNRKNRVASKA